MRTIDADALREVLETTIPIIPITQQYNKEDVIRAIMDAPTIARGTDSIMIKWTPDLDMLARGVAYRGLNEFSFMGKSIREWVEIILEQMARAAWVSVKDRLPENQDPVIVYVPPHDDDCIGYVGMAYYTRFGEGFWCGSDGNTYGAIGIIHPPTHWMPLPEPPEEDDGK